MLSSGDYFLNLLGNGMDQRLAMCGLWYPPKKFPTIKLLETGRRLIGWSLLLDHYFVTFVTSCHFWRLNGRKRFGRRPFDPDSRVILTGVLGVWHLLVANHEQDDEKHQRDEHFEQKHQLQKKTIYNSIWYIKSFTCSSMNYLSFIRWGGRGGNWYQISKFNKSWYITIWGTGSPNAISASSCTNVIIVAQFNLSLFTFGNNV